MKIKKQSPVSIVVSAPLFLVNEIALLSIVVASLVLSIKKKPYEILLLISAYLTFQWSLSAVSGRLFPGLVEAHYIKTICGAIFFGVLAFNFAKKINKAQLFCAIILGGLCIKGLILSEDKLIALKYIINMYLPLVAAIVILSSGSSGGVKRVDVSINFYLLVIVVVSVAGAAVNKFTGYDSLVFFTSALSDGRQDTEELSAVVDGSYKWLATGIFTKVAGFFVVRNPGFIVDSILAGYVFSFSAIYIYYFVNRMKMVLLLVTMVLLFLTYSKGAWMALVMMFFISEINKLFWDLSPLRKISLNVMVVVLAVTGLVFIASNSVGDSSYIHYLGLTQTFSQNPSLFGHDLASGGNYANIDFSDKLMRGAESTVGAIFYHTGALGVLSFFFLNFITLSVLSKTKSEKHSVLISILMTQFIVSFLQENTYNLSYVIPRIVIIIAIFYQVQKLECKKI